MRLESSDISTKLRAKLLFCWSLGICWGISRVAMNTGPAGCLICCVFIRGTLLDNIRAPYWLLQEGWKIRRFVLLYHFFSTAYYARVNRAESFTTRKGFEQIARSQRVYQYFEQVKFPPDTELLHWNWKGWNIQGIWVLCGGVIFSPSILGR